MSRGRQVGMSMFAALVLAAPLQAQTFDFEAVASGTTTPFSVTSGGVTAAFSAPTNVFFVDPAFFSTLTGNVLLDADGIPYPLLIAFSTPLSAISMNFALNSGTGGGALNVDAYLGTTLVGSASAGSAVPGGFFFPEGVLTFVGGPFDNVVLTSAEIDFAIDNVTVRPANGVVPEPATVMLVGSGLIAIGLVARRRRA